MGARLSHLGMLIVLFGPAVAAAGQSWALRYSYDRQNVLVEDSDSLDITGPLTVEAWVRPEPGIQEKWFDFIVSKQMSGTGYTLLSAGLDENHFYFEAYVSAESASQVPLDQWVHVAGVWEAGELRIYVDGQLDGLRDSPIAPQANEFPLWIGSSPFGVETNWRGAIDEVRIWAVARTQDEILWDMYHPLSGNEGGLRAYWNFDEGAGQVLHDLANGNDGRLGDSWDPDPYDPEWVAGVALPQPFGWLDIKPGSCPNPLNRTSQGVLPVGWVGDMDYDVTLIDLDTVRLERVDGVGGQVAPLMGPSGAQPEFEDVATPFLGEPCGCHELTSDGFIDLTLKFSTPEVADILELDSAMPGDEIGLRLIWIGEDETEYRSTIDCIRIVPLGRPLSGAPTGRG